MKMLAESSRPGHGPTYAIGKAHDLHARPTHDVLVWVSHNLDSWNRGELADMLKASSGRNVDTADLAAAARVEKALGSLPTLDLRDLLS
ncbi:hypothetical protein [Variovorax gossypii]